MMVRLGNFLFRNRNGLFPIFYLMLFVPSPHVFSNPATAMIIGFTIAVAGQLLRVVTIGLVYIMRGGRNRRVYAEELVTTGLFAHCRNPLYVGNILILAGLGVASNSLIFMTLFIPLFFFFYQAIVMAEEKFLENKFGEEYQAYRERVNRWIPKISGIDKTIRSMTFKWKRVVIREYNSTYIWMTGAVLIIMNHAYQYEDRFNFTDNLPLYIGLLAGLLCLYLFARYLKKSKVLISD